MADAGPLIGLARIDGLDLTPVLFAETLVTETVLAECLARPDRPEGARIPATVDNCVRPGPRDTSPPCCPH